MHNPLGPVIALSLAFLCGCSSVGSVDIKTSERSYETDYSSVSVEEITILGSSDFLKQQNTEIYDELNGAMIGFDTDALENAQNMILGNKSTFDVKYNIAYNKNNFLSIVEERYIYLGGAHGNSEWIARNIDLEKETSVTLDDLFMDDSYVETLNRLIRAEIAEKTDEYKDLWEEPVIKNNTDFYISDGSLVIFFPPYDLSYYARGFVEFPININDLRGHIKEEYLRLAK